MSLELAFASALSGAESLINQALELDPQSKKKLLILKGKLIGIQSSRPNLGISMNIHDHGLLLTPLVDPACDVVIQGNASALLNVLLAKDKSAAMRQQNIYIQGDAGVIQLLQDVLNGLNLDWEYQFSELLGDVPTQMLSDSLKQLKKFMSHTHSRMRANLDEYLHEESALLPGKNELKVFYQRIDDLRLKIDRFNSRLQKLNSK
jgi:ubiquinone biosynthesis protein UbiJ